LAFASGLLPLKVSASGFEGISSSHILSPHAVATPASREAEEETDFAFPGWG
jgi:hypothetical protein